MLTEDELVQQLLELDAEIEAAEQRRQLNKRAARTWASSGLDTELDILSGNEANDASRWIQQLRDQREALARGINELAEHSDKENE